MISCSAKYKSTTTLNANMAPLKKPMQTDPIFPPIESLIMLFLRMKPDNKCENTNTNPPYSPKWK